MAFVIFSEPRERSAGEWQASRRAPWCGLLCHCGCTQCAQGSFTRLGVRHQAYHQVKFTQINLRVSIVMNVISVSPVSPAASEQTRVSISAPLIKVNILLDVIHFCSELVKIVQTSGKRRMKWIQ